MAASAHRSISLFGQAPTMSKHNMQHLNCSKDHGLSIRELPTHPDSHPQQKTPQKSQSNHTNSRPLLQAPTGTGLYPLMGTLGAARGQGCKFGWVGSSLNWGQIDRQLRATLMVSWLEIVFIEVIFFCVGGLGFVGFMGLQSFQPKSFLRPEF